MKRIVRLTESDLERIVRKVIIEQRSQPTVKKYPELIEEQIVDNTVQLVKDIISFIWSMNIVPGPIEGGRLIYDIYQTKQPIETIKKYVNSKISSPGENWKKIELSLDKLGNDVDGFKNELYKQLKNKIQLTKA